MCIAVSTEYFIQYCLLQCVLQWPLAPVWTCSGKLTISLLLGLDVAASLHYKVLHGTLYYIAWHCVLKCALCTTLEPCRTGHYYL